MHTDNVHSCFIVEISFINHCGCWGACRYRRIEVSKRFWRGLEAKVKHSKLMNLKHPLKVSHLHNLNPCTYFEGFKKYSFFSRRSTSTTKSGGGRAISTGGGAGSMWKFYTGDDSPGIKM